jgi:hypothetical protein
MVQNTSIFRKVARAEARPVFPVTLATSGLLFVTFAAFAALALGCGRKAPSPVRRVLETHRPTVVTVAEKAARLCPAVKAGAPFQRNPADVTLPTNPAVGTPLEDEPKIVEVMVACSWPDPRDPTKRMWSGTSLQTLRATSAVPVRKVTMPDDIIEDTCDEKGKEHDCEQLRTPSRFVATERSVDLRVVRPTLDGGEAEVIVVIAAPES